MLRWSIPALLSLPILLADIPFKVPEGFRITEYASDSLTHDTWALTISEEGKDAVSGPGYIKVLLDTDEDGIPDIFDTDDDGDGWNDTSEIDCGTDPLYTSAVHRTTIMTGFAIL